MSTTTDRTADLPTSPPRGFPGLPCLRCGEVGDVNLNLNEITGDEALYCGNCDAKYGLDEVRDTVATWQKVLAWVDLAPIVEG